LPKIAEIKNKNGVSKGYPQGGIPTEINFDLEYLAENMIMS